MIGCGTWIIHNLYLQGRTEGNSTMLKQVVFPMLRAFVQVYNHHRFTDGDGVMHLPYTNSPEYPKQLPGNDTNYDVALFKWGAATLLELSSEFGIDDPLVPDWKSIIQSLTPGPVDADGSYMVNSNTPFSVSHRHFSHLFHIYPLHVVVMGASAHDDALITTSLDKWTGLTCGKDGACPNGFTFDGAASMSALIPGREDAAAGNISQFVLKSGKVHKSTMYAEGHSPCIESPLAAANSMQELLLQSWGGIIRVFPSVPHAWPSVMFDRMWAEGGIVVSARRENGSTQFVQLCNRGEMSGAVQLETDVALVCPTTQVQPHRESERSLVSLTVQKGECVVCHRAGVSRETLRIDSADMPGYSADYNYFGQQ